MPDQHTHTTTRDFVVERCDNCHTMLSLCEICHKVFCRFCQRERGAAIEEAKEHHRKHGDMDGPVCLLNKCAWHYPYARDQIEASAS